MPNPSVSERTLEAVVYTTPNHLAVRRFHVQEAARLPYPRVVAPNVIGIPGGQQRRHFVGVRVEGCGICATDVHMHQGKRFADEKATVAQPLIPGHEIFGVVEEADGEYAALRGKTVVIDPMMDCYGRRRCPMCAQDKRYMHSPFTEIGICGGVPGGLSTYVFALGKNCHPAEGLDVHQKAVTELLATVLYALQDVLALDHRRRRCLILGGGPAGLLMLQCLKNLNPRNDVTVLERVPLKQKVARALGADDVIETRAKKPEHAAADLKERIGSDGFDLVLEMSGSDKVVELIPWVVSRLGCVLFFGLGHQSVKFDAFDLFIEKEVRCYASLGASSSTSFTRAAQLARKIDAAKMVTHAYHGLDQLKQAVQEDYFDKTYIKGVMLP